MTEARQPCRDSRTNPLPHAIAPRGLTRVQAAAYCGVSPSSFDRMRSEGLLPGPMRGIRRWDLLALDDALDALSGRADATMTRAPLSALDQWRQSRDAG